MSRFASRTAFDLLAVDDGNDGQSSEEELAPEPETAPSAPYVSWLHKSIMFTTPRLTKYIYLHQYRNCEADQDCAA